MLAHTRRRLIAHGRPWVMENVERADMPGALTLCGSEFGLGASCKGGWRQLRRHRKFESNMFLMGAGGCAHNSLGPVGVYGEGTTGKDARGYKGTAQERREAMNIDWMTQMELAQAIPPAFTMHIAEQILELLAVAA